MKFISITLNVDALAMLGESRRRSAELKELARVGDPFQRAFAIDLLRREARIERATCNKAYAQCGHLQN